VNISGGLRTIYCAGEDALVAAFQQLGTKSRVPNLWIYARNDSFFTPTLVEKIPAAFREGRRISRTGSAAVDRRRRSRTVRLIERPTAVAR